MDLVGLVALCYHKVGTEEAEGRRLNIHPVRLDSHIRHFQRRGYRFIRAVEADPADKNRSVCFTFDDGFVSTLENGAAVFDRHGLPMTVYIVSELVGHSSEWEGEQSRPLATWQGLVDLQSRGHEVGNHSASHPKFADLSLDDQLDQIRTCHEAMVGHGLKPESFCYPYGSLNTDSIRAVANCGYRVGMALGKRPAKPTDPRLAIPRVVVAYGDSLPMLLYKLHLKPFARRSRPLH